MVYGPFCIPTSLLEGLALDQVGSTASVTPGISPCVWGVSLWEDLFVVSEKWIPFPTALRRDPYLVTCLRNGKLLDSVKGTAPFFQQRSLCGETSLGRNLEGHRQFHLRTRFSAHAEKDSLPNGDQTMHLANSHSPTAHVVVGLLKYHQWSDSSLPQLD